MNNDWGTSIKVIPSTLEPVILDFPPGANTPIIISNYQTLYSDYGNYPTLIIHEKIDAFTLRERTDIQAAKNYINNSLDSISIDIPTNAAGQTLTHLQLIIKP